MIEEVNIKTKLLFFWEDDFQKFKELACEAMKKHWEDDEQNANLPDLLIHILKTRDMKTPLHSNIFKEGKHKKTTLLYFSQNEQEVFTNLMDILVFKKIVKSGCKKQALTNAVLKLLKEYLNR